MNGCCIFIVKIFLNVVLPSELCNNCFIILLSFSSKSLQRGLLCLQLKFLEIICSLTGLILECSFSGDFRSGRADRLFL